jgi:hypothetical protein
MQNKQFDHINAIVPTSACAVRIRRRRPQPQAHLRVSEEWKDRPVKEEQFALLILRRPSNRLTDRKRTSFRMLVPTPKDWETQTDSYLGISNTPS